MDQLEAAFTAASAPFHNEIRQVEKAIEDFQKEVDAGKATWSGETDDADCYGYGDHLGDRKEHALDVLVTLRKAFTFLIYHEWKLLVQHWTKPGESPRHEDLVRAAKAAGVPLDEPGLEMLRLLVNTLKHNSTRWGRKLYDLRPDLFKAFDPDADNPVTGRPYTVIHWASRIVLADTNIKDFFTIVRNSLPR